jgi:hypothetical protein
MVSGNAAPTFAARSAGESGKLEKEKAAEPVGFSWNKLFYRCPHASGHLQTPFALHCPFSVEIIGQRLHHLVSSTHFADRSSL